MNNLKLLYSLAFLIFGLQAVAQDIYTGKVVDNESLEPLAYASVYWKNSKKGVLTDEQGLFSIFSEKDSLTISFIGYKNKIISASDLKSGEPIALISNDIQIEEVIVSPVDAEEIMKKAIAEWENNHFSNQTKQSGFSRLKFFKENQLFQISEIAYDVEYFENEDGFKQDLYPIKSRSVIDSAIVKQINDMINRKKDTLLIQPESFIGFGQKVDQSNFTEDNKKITTEYVYNGKTEYQGREAYDISSISIRKKTPFLKGRFLIDQQSFAFLMMDVISVNEEDFNKFIPLHIRALLGLLGYKIRLNNFAGIVYFRANEDQFEIDKGFTNVTASFAKGGEWMTGKFVEEFYLNLRSSSDKLPENKKVNVDQIVRDFEKNYFEKKFYLPTTEKVLMEIDEINERNKEFQGKIISERHEKWLKKKKK